MALAGPSCLPLSISTIPRHLPLHLGDTGTPTFAPHHSDGDDDMTDASGEGAGKGKCEDWEDIGDSVCDLERDLWGLWSLFELGEENVEEVDRRIEEQEQEQNQVEVAPEREIPTDGLAQIEIALERRERAIERTLPVLATDAPEKIQTVGGRFASAFRKIWSKSKSLTSHSFHDCIICQESIQDQEIRVPCGHYYDKECIISLFRASTKDESLFPPRCCRQTIPIIRVQKHFTPALTKEFAEKSKEFGTLRRVYCADPTCSRFLGQQIKGIAWLAPGRKVYRCSCGVATCGKCKNAHRDGMKHTCSSNSTDHGMEVVLELGKENGWARCPGCRTMIELNMGCYHMTCLCKAEFCYLCQARWKTCACSQWDETRLVAVAEERIDHQVQLDDAPDRAPVLGRFDDFPIRRRPLWIRQNREELIQAAVDALRDNHDCEHIIWRYRDGGGRCVGCYDFLDRYVYHCIGCHTIACNRCRHNRF